MLKILRNSGIYVMLFLSILFPFVTFGRFSFDTAPYFLVFTAIIFLIGHNYRFDKFIAPLFFSAAAAMALAVIEPGMDSFRGAFGYISLPLVAVVTTTVWARFKPERTLWFFLLVLLVFALVQWAGFGYLVLPLIPSARSTIGNFRGRGVPSLTSEPGMYAIAIIFSLIFIDILHGSIKKKNRILLIAVAAFQIIFLSRAGLGLFMLVFYGVIAGITSSSRIVRLMTLFIGISLFFTATLILMSLNTDIRAVFLLTKFFEDPLSFLSVDYSVRDRYLHIYWSFEGALRQWLFPHGFSSFATYLAQSIGGSMQYVSYGNRIMSWIGSVLFELGVFGLPILASFYGLLYRATDSRRQYVRLVIVSTVLLVNSVAIGVPWVGLYFGLLVYAKNQKKPGFERNLLVHKSLLDESGSSTWFVRTD